MKYIINTTSIFIFSLFMYGCENLNKNNPSIDNVLQRNAQDTSNIEYTTHEIIGVDQDNFDQFVYSAKKHDSGAVKGNPPSKSTIITINQNDYEFYEIKVKIDNYLGTFNLLHDSMFIKINSYINFKSQTLTVVNQAGPNYIIKEIALLRDPNLPLNQSNISMCNNWKIIKIDPTIALNVLLENEYTKNDTIIKINYIPIKIAKNNDTLNVHYRIKDLTKLSEASKDSVFYSDLNIIKYNPLLIELLWYDTLAFHHSPHATDHSTILNSPCPY